MASMTITSPEMAKVFSPATKKMGKKTEIHRRGRSVTVRSPEDSTNAACNIYGGKYTARTQTKRSYHSSPHSRQLDNHDPLSFVAAIAFVDRFALFGNTTLALITSFGLLVVAVVISFLLEDIIDAEAEI